SHASHRRSRHASHRRSRHASHRRSRHASHTRSRHASHTRSRHASHRRSAHCSVRASRLQRRKPGDTTPPTAPPNLTAAPGDARGALSWGASTDNLGVAGYRLYRNGGQVTHTSSTSFTDIALTNGTTYSYYVVAYDAAGNVSSPSNRVSGTPTSSTPGPTGESGPTGASGETGPSGSSGPTG